MPVRTRRDNRRQLVLTPAGLDMVGPCRHRLATRLITLMEDSTVPDAEYDRYTRQLLAALDAGEPVQIERARR